LHSRGTTEVDFVETILALVQLALSGQRPVRLAGVSRRSGSSAVGCRSYLGISDVCIKGVPFLSVVLSLFVAGVTAVISRLRKLYLDVAASRSTKAGAS